MTQKVKNYPPEVQAWIDARRRHRLSHAQVQMARELGISPRHLTGLCRRLFGDSPARLLLRLKLRRADEMLRYGDRRVKEVSDALGFANPFHFSRVFRRHLGRSPSQR